MTIRVGEVKEAFAPRRVPGSAVRPQTHAQGAAVRCTRRRPCGWATGAYLSLAANAVGLTAAAPGLIDNLSAIPPHSSGRARATQHLLVNVSPLLAVSVAWASRDRTSLMPGTGTLVLEAAGVALVTWGGWIGDTPVYRDQIGVDHRYAGAGKWKEEVIEGHPRGPIVVARAEELEVDQMKLVRVDGRRIVLARAEQGYIAFEDRCSHKTARWPTAS